MKYRVSFYRKAERVDGRAPRYMVDFEADTLEQAKLHFEQDADVVVRSVYKAPDKPIRQKPSYVFETAADRNDWYSSHKTAQKDRLCHKCNKNEVERYKRLCTKCAAEREEAAKKTCVECKAEIPTSSRRRYCDACATKRKESQEKFHREKRAKKHTIDRISKQVAWAKSKLATTVTESCKLASRYQGLRIPHVSDSGVRCRTCLHKFIEIQTIYLENLKAAEAAENQTDDTLMEDLRAHAASNAN